APEILVMGLNLTLDYPDHTGLESHTLRNVGSELKVFRGTRVALEGALAKPDIKGATLIITDEEGASTEFALTVEDQRVKGSFVAMSAGTLRFRLVGQDAAVF